MGLMQKKYQVFVSSTFKDLVEERQSVLEAILELNHIPCGMEAFPANSATPFELIQKMIDDSDYYVLVIGGRYGSVSDTGLGFTEMEYDYAVAQGKHILCFVHKNPEELPSKNVDSSVRLVKMLEQFRKKAQRHHAKYWLNKFDLKSLVTTSLSISFQTNPMKGWVKLSAEFDEDILIRLSELQKKYNDLQEKYIQLRDASSTSDEIDLKQYEQKLDVEFSITHAVNYDRNRSQDKFHKIEFSYLQLFFCLSEVIIGANSPRKIVLKLSALIYANLVGTEELMALQNENFNGADLSDKLIVTLQSYKRIKIQFVSFGWIEIDSMTRMVAGLNGRGSSEVIDEVWRLTDKGKKIISKNLDKVEIS